MADVAKLRERTTAPVHDGAERSLKWQRDQAGASNLIAVPVQINLIVLIGKKCVWARFIADAVLRVARDNRSA